MQQNKQGLLQERCQGFEVRLDTINPEQRKEAC